MWRIVLALLLMFVPLAAQAQEERAWEDGCDARAIALIEPTEGAFDYSAACETYRACDPNGEGDFRCQMVALETLQKQCLTDDLICPKAAMLYAAAILAFDMPFGEMMGWKPAQTIIDGVPQGLAAFQAGDYEAALAAYQMTPFDNQNGDTMLPFSRAIVYEMLGEAQAATAEYASIFQTVFEHPLAWYARAQLFGSQGWTDEASFDATALSIFVESAPELADLVSTVVARYPLTRMEDWLMYPVESVSYGVGGTFFNDLTLTPPRSIQVGFYDNLDGILVIGASRLLGNSPDDPYRFVQFLKNSGDGRYRLEYPSYYENFGSLILVPNGDTLRGSESIAYFEGAADLAFRLAPANAPDPRADLESQRLCAGSVRSRLTVGTSVRTPWHGEDPVTLYSPPGGTEISSGNRLTVVGGPECLGSVTWWQAENLVGETGWFPENDGTQYTVNPLEEEATLENSCPLMPRLAAGLSGRVVFGLGPNNLRSQADANSALLTTIPEGAIFTIQFGPSCIDGINWWLVTYNGVAGWTAEGEGSTYWLEPSG